jgi:hypothetical protein
MAVLCISGSEASVERSFSVQGTVHSDRRNRLSDPHVEAEVFIRFNTAALARQPGRQRVKAAELGLEMKEEDEVDEVPQMEGLFSRVRVDAELDAAPAAEEKEEAKEELPAEAAASAAAVRVSSVAAPPPSADDVQRFIEQFVRDNSVTSRYRWNDDRSNELLKQAICFSPPIRDTDVVLRKRIKAYCRAAEAAEASEEVADEVIYDAPVAHGS